jgi:hypothetical protein
MSSEDGKEAFKRLYSVVTPFSCYRLIGRRAVGLLREVAIPANRREDGRETIADDRQTPAGNP